MHKPGFHPKNNYHESLVKIIITHEEESSYNILMVQITSEKCSSLAIIHMHVAKIRALGQCNSIKN